MNKYITELIGTFFLVLTIGLTVTGGSTLAALAIGTSLMVMVYMGGHISGAHYNPAVSLAVWMRGKIETVEAAKYMVFQVVGAILAGYATIWFAGEPLTITPAIGVSSLQALGVEILFTFALALVVLQTATNDATAGNSYYGLAIGFTIFMGAAAGGPISGGAFNPAVGLGPAIVDAVTGGSSISSVWIYLVGPFTGGALAAVVYKMQS
ncbi:MAG: MIP/aquaporin family protein [Rhodothermia bacterium]